MQTIDIDGTPFAVEIEGQAGEPVLLLSNSLSSDMTMWDDQVPRFAEHFRVVRYDARGHGKTRASPAPYTIARLGRDALAVLDALRIEHAHFCGLSLGGMVGMWLATYAGERLSRAVLANTSAHMGPPSLWDARIALARDGGMEGTVEPTVNRWFPPAFQRRAPQTIERMRAMIRRTSVEGYVGCCEAIRDMDQRQSIRAIRTATLVIIGANDPATTPDAGKEIHRAIAGSTIAVLDASHISNVEQPDAFTATVLRFLLA